LPLRLSIFYTPIKLWETVGVHDFPYVERNPVRAGMVLRAEDYPWSSARAHCGFGTDPLLSSLPEPSPVAIENWSAWLHNPDDENILKQIRLCTRTGRPFGTDNFVRDLGKRLGPQLRALRIPLKLST
jgi:putative transposase